MRKVALRGLVAHKLRLAMTILAVALGVAFVAGVLTFTDTMQDSFDELFDTVYDGTDAVVRSDETVGGDFEEERGTLDEPLLQTVRDVPTVDKAAGEVEGFVQVLDQNGDEIGGGMFGSPTFAGSYDPDQADDDDNLNLFGLRDGSWPSADDQIVMDVSSVQDNDFSIGDTVPVQTRAGLGEYELVGAVGFGDRDNAAGAGIVLFTVGEAQRTVGEPGRFNTISVVATDGTSQQQVADDINTALADAGAANVEVLTGDQMVDDVQDDVAQGLTFLTIFFLIFAIIAVIVGSFVIYNSFSIIIAQRTREMALLRAVGASRRQVRRSVFLEAMAIGLLGSLLGLLLGLGIASLLSSLMEVEGSLVVLPPTIVTALLVGLVVTLLSSLLPAWKASRVPPVAAMRDVDVDTTGRSRVRLIVGLVLTALGIAVAVAGSVGHEVAQVGYGVAVVFVGVIFLAPGIARPLSGILGWPLARFRGVTGALATENAARNPRRTASTGLALMIGVGIVAFFLVLNASLRSSFDKVLEENFAGDFIVDASSDFGGVGMPDQVAQDVAALREVDRVVPMRFANANDADGDSRTVTGTNADAFDAFSMDVTGSSELAPGEILVKKEAAESRGLAEGDQVTFDFLDAETATLTVAGTFEGSPETPMSDYVISSQEMADLVSNSQDSMIVVDLASGISPDAGRTAIEDVVEPISPTADVQDENDIKEDLSGQLDTMLQIILALLWLAIMIAGIGIANTISLSVMERTRELGLLRAVGMSRRQLRSTIRWESVIVALFGTLLGMAIGVLGSWGMVTALGDEGFEVFTLPIGTLVLLAFLAGGLGLLAAMWPAWRAGRLNVLDAVHHE